MEPGRRAPGVGKGFCMMMMAASMRRSVEGAAGAELAGRAAADGGALRAAVVLGDLHVEIEDAVGAVALCVAWVAGVWVAAGVL